MIISCCEKDYRAYPALNYSSLKDFDNNRISYYFDKVLGQKEAKVMSNEVKLGAAVDVLLLEADKYDEKFVKPVFNKPTGQMGEFMDEFWTQSQIFIDDDGKFTETFENRLKYAWDVFTTKNPDKFKGKDIDFIKENFAKTQKDGTCPRDYYIDLMATAGKVIIDEKMDKKARKIVESIKNGKYTKELFQPSRLITLDYQVAIVGEINGEPVKGLLDIIKIDHSKKTVTGIDLKTSWQTDAFSYTFKKFKYYLQASLYHYLLEQYIKDKNLDGYSVDNQFLFLVCDSSMQYHPHFEKVDEDLLHKGMYGFIDSFGMRYKGVYEILNEIKFCIKNNDFYDSLELDENKGINAIKC